MSGIEGIRILKERYPALLLLMLTVYDDDERIFDALCAGACGYLLKRTPPARLLEYLKEAVDGGAPISPEIARRVVGLFREIRPPDRTDYQLTPHEERLLKLLVEVITTTAAAKLNVTSIRSRRTCITSGFSPFKSEAVAAPQSHHSLNRSPESRTLSPIQVMAPRVSFS
jgi:hypothetical protein